MIGRRGFLSLAGAVLASRVSGPGGLVQRQSRAWRDLRLVERARASAIERSSTRDAATLLSRAIGRPVPVLIESSTWGSADVFVEGGLADPSLPAVDGPLPSAPGSFRIQTFDSPGRPFIVISGVDPEGARNGLYAFLEHLGFGFFRDGETVPTLGGHISLGRGFELASNPTFRWRGDMIWDNYLGPRRYCASVWDESDWERALLFMARNRMNFLEFYPPLERVLAIALPHTRGLADGAVWKADFKHVMARRVLARGRELGIRFMYVLNYGFFPEPIRDRYPNLVWANGHLCADQPELAELAARTWRTLLAEFGTDHLYAIRHRGEEGQSYSDPCRTVTKVEGFRQAIDVMKRIDPDATITVWTWGEQLPDLFSAFPTDVRAVHVRHGMGGVFGHRGSGREQPDGAPPLPRDRRWLAGQFTVFGGNQTLLETPWCDADALARDARSAASDGRCEGYYQWPEWSDTSPWTSTVIARLASNPQSFAGREQELRAYAERRHGRFADAFLSAALPLVRAGNARITSTPRKRLFVPYFLTRDELTELAAVRDGVRAMRNALAQAESLLLDRDFVDLCTWTGVRQAHVFEAAAYLAHLARRQAEALSLLESAETSWGALHNLLTEVPELSIIEAARVTARTGPPSERFIESFWTNACDFYGGYPLVMSPEAIELVYLDQLRRLRTRVQDAARAGTMALLEPPGWFWHDFPDPAWAEAVRELPREDSVAFEQVMKQRLAAVLEKTASARQEVEPSGAGRVSPSANSRVSSAAASEFVARAAALPLPSPLAAPPVIPGAKGR